MECQIFLGKRARTLQGKWCKHLLFSAVLLRTGLFCFIFIFYHCTASFCQKNHGVYTTFLEKVVPENGELISFTSPVLRWPYQKGKGVKYEVQLSQDSVFTQQSTIIGFNLNSAFFNPHQQLSVGIWYWRFRVIGKKWSAINRFTIQENSNSLISPPPVAFLDNIPNGHPRLLVYDPKDNLHHLQGGDDASAIIAEAELAVNHPILTEADGIPQFSSRDEKQNKKIRQDAVVALGNRINSLIVALSQGYLLTGKQAYAYAAIQFGDQIAGWDPEGLSATSDFTDGVTMYSMALVFDTFYDQLTEEQQSKLLYAITYRAERFYESWRNNIESKVLSGHVWQLLLNEFFKSSIAVYRHDSRAGKWLEYLYELFLARAPVLGGSDGGWAEGAYYLQLNMEMLLEIPDRIKAYTGFDFIQSHPWYQNQVNWMIYHFPAGSSNDGFGDNAEDYFSPPASYVAFATELARLTKNGHYLGYANQIQQFSSFDLSKEKMLRWFRLTHAVKNTLPEYPAELEMPLAYRSLETGVAALHTSPGNTPADIMVSFRSSPFGAYGHILADQNTFNILAGGKRLFYRTGYKVAMDDPHRLGWSKHTKSMNGILIDGEGQPYSIESFGKLKRFISGKNLSYVVGDASNAYRSSETNQDIGLKKFFRHMLLLKPGIVIVYDELEADSPKSWSWLIHAHDQISLDSSSGRFKSGVDSFSGVGRLWGSIPLLWQIADTFEIPAVDFRDYPGKVTKNYNNDQWHVKATGNSRVNSMRFLSIIKITNNGDTFQEISDVSAENGVVKVKLDNWIVEADVSVLHPPRLTVSSRARKTFFSAYQIPNKHNIKKKEHENANSVLVEKSKGVKKVLAFTDEPLILKK